MKDHLTPFVEQITHAPATVMAGDVVEAGKVREVIEAVYADTIERAAKVAEERYGAVTAADAIRALPLEDKP